MPMLCRTERREGDTASKRKKMERDSKEEVIFGNQEKAFQGTCFSIGLRFRRRRMNEIPAYIFVRLANTFIAFGDYCCIIRRILSPFCTNNARLTHWGTYHAPITNLAHLMTLLSYNSSFVSTLCDSRISDTFTGFVLTHYNMQLTHLVVKKVKTSWRNIYLPSSSLILK